MKKNNILFCLLVGLGHWNYSSVSLQVIQTPDFVLYNKIFAKFNRYIHQVDGVDMSQIYPFETMMFALWYNTPAQTKIMLEIDYGSSIIGFALCNLLSATHLIVRQFVIDPDVFQGAMLAPLLGQTLSFMPQISQVSVLCPATFETTIATLQAIGFELNESVMFPVEGVYQQWELSLRNKCAICDVLYPEEFWDQPDESDSELDCE